MNVDIAIDSPSVNMEDAEAKVVTALTGAMFNFGSWYTGGSLSLATVETELNGVDQDTDADATSLGFSGTYVYNKSDTLRGWATLRGNFNVFDADKIGDYETFNYDLRAMLHYKYTEKISIQGGPGITVGIPQEGDQTRSGYLKVGAEHRGEFFQPQLGIGYTWNFEGDEAEMFDIGSDLNWRSGPHAVGVGYAYNTLMNSTTSGLDIDVYSVHFNYRYQF